MRAALHNVLSGLQAPHITYSYQCYKLMNNVVQFMLNIFEWPKSEYEQYTSNMNLHL